jgi:DNA-binding SARP family transcriptional activator
MLGPSITTVLLVGEAGEKTQAHVEAQSHLRRPMPSSALRLAGHVGRGEAGRLRLWCISHSHGWTEHAGTTMSHALRAHPQSAEVGWAVTAVRSAPVRQLRLATVPQPAPTEVRLLGPGRVTQAGRIVGGFESRKALALLAYLASRGCPVPRTVLADLLWPDLGEARGRANLSGALHSLTALLPPCLDADRHVVAYRPSPALWLDIEMFRAYTARGDTASLAAATDLYGDEFLAGLYLDDCPEFELWAVTRREWWRNRVAELLARLVDNHLAAGDRLAALAAARRLLELEPWREEVHRQVMVLLIQSGRRGCALAQFRTCCRVLQAEFGVQPSAETLALYQHLCTGASA